MSSRSTLKDYFKTNAVPTQNNFSDLMDSVFIQSEDGIRKQGTAPVALEAQADNNGEQPVLHFYKSFTDKDAAWKFSLLNQNAANPASGLTISSTVAGQSSLFIRESDGSVGIGTTSPGAKLHVKGGNTLIEGKLGIGRITANFPGYPLSFPEDLGDKITFWGQTGNIYGIGIQAYTLQLYAPDALSNIAFGLGNSNKFTELMHLSGNGNLGIGTNAPQAKLQVTGGAIMPEVGNSKTAGIFFPENMGGGGGDAAWLRYYIRDNPEGTTLELGISNDSDDHIALMPSGNVGIGTNSPKAKLHVAGAIHAGNSDIYFTETAHNHTGYGNTLGYAALENDGGSYNALMILGRERADKRRYVSLWDQLNIIGTAYLNNAALMASDVRIKNKIATSNTGNDLTILNKLKVKDYSLRNSGKNESCLQKGFIAQEVEEILPNAVVLQSDFIANVFAKPESAVIKEGVLVVTMKNNHGFATGDIVRFTTSSGNKDYSIEVIDEQMFSVDNWKESTSDIFVYGKKTEDFRSLDYQQIFTLGISAIQELYKQLQQLGKEIEAVKERLSPAFASVI